MSQTILLKRSSVPAKVPTVGQLSAGELALNTNDGKAFFLNAAGDSVLELGASTFTGDVTGSGSTAVALTLSNTGVSAGSYNNVTVDAKGRVTAASTAAYLTANQAITASGDISGSGTTALTLTLPTINTNVGTYNNVTVNGKGQVTAASNVAYLTANQSVTLSGDITGSGTTAITGTLATVNSNVGSFGDSSHVTAVTVNAKGLVTAASAVLITPAAIGAINTNQLGANSGVATLDATGKLTTAQIPAALVGAMQYQGVWNASTNTPAIASGTGTKGYYYKVSVDGTTSIDGNANWTVGDLIVFDGTTWDLVQGGSSDVSSVFGRVGAVTLQGSDVTTALGFTPYDEANPSNFISANQSITVSGDATGSGTTAISLTLANSGVTADTYPKVTVDAKGRVTAGAALIEADLPSHNQAWSTITATPTTVAGYGITDGLTTASTIDGGTY